MSQQTEINEEMQAWLTKVVIWQKVSVVTMVDQVRCKKQLIHFLSSLNSFMCYVDDTDDILKTLPLVGQFLGRIITLSLLMVENDFFKVVMKCVFMFYKHYPQNEVEEKAKSWVLSQVNYTCNGPKESKAIQKVLDVTGSSERHLPLYNYDQTADNVGISVYLDQKPGCLPISEEQHKDILHLMQVYLSCRNSQPFDILINVMVKYMLQQAGVYGHLRNEEMVILKEISGHSIVLSYENQVILWKKYKFTLEVHVLNIVGECATRFTYVKKQDVIDAVSKGHLVRACAESETLYTCVNNFLEQLYVKSEAYLLVHIKYWIHELICQYIGESSNVELSIRKYFPHEVHAIVQLLLNSPLGFSKNCCEHQMKQITSIKTAMLTESKENHLISLQHKFLPWQYTTLILSLLCSTEIVDYTLEVLQMFYLWPAHLHECTRDLVISLRGLLSNTSVSKQHLQCIMANSEDTKYIPILKYFYRQLWMVFLLFSESSIIIYNDIIEMVLPCANRSCVEYLQLVTETLEMLSFLPTWTISNVKWKKVSSILSSIHAQVQEQSDSSAMTLNDQQLLKEYIKKSNLLLKEFYCCN